MKTWIKPGVWAVLALFLAAWAGDSFAQESGKKAPTQAVKTSPCECRNDFAFVPDNAALCLTVKVSELAGKLGLKELDKVPTLSEMSGRIGISLDNVESFTLALAPEEVAIIRTKQPCNQKEILSKNVHDAKQVKYLGHTCYVNGGPDSMAVCFVDDHLVVIACSEAGLKRCLEQPEIPSRRQQDLADFLKQAGRHDLAAWANPRNLPECLPEEIKSVLQKGIESCTAAVDVGEQINLEMQIQCADEATALWTKKAMQTGMDMIRCELEMVVSMVNAAELFPAMMGEEQQVKQFKMFPLKLIQQSTKGLHKAKPKVEGTMVSLSIVIPMSPKVLRSEVAGLIKLMGSEQEQAQAKPPERYGPDIVITPPGGGVSVGFGIRVDAPLDAKGVNTVGGAVFGAAAVAGAGPAIIAGSMCNGVATAKGGLIGGAAGAGIGALAGGGKGAQIGGHYPGTPWPEGSQLPPVVQVGGVELAPPPATGPAPTPAPGTIKLTVVNVHKEPALLFTMDEAGKLTFKHKLPEGEAVDVQVIKGQHWIAIFSEKPAGESYKVTQADAIWLLR